MTKQIDTKRSLRQYQAPNQKESQPFDQCQTPQYAVEPLFPYLPKSWLIWESACGECNLSRHLIANGYNVLATDILHGNNFFNINPKFDCQVTNPPYSIKLDWLRRSYHLGKPFALLLPVELLGVGQAQAMFNQYGLEVILLNRRVGFQTINTTFAKSSAWFPTAWFCFGLNIGRQLTFAKIIKRPNEQMALVL